MYECFRIYYRKIVNRLPKDFIRRFLSLCACAVISLSLLIQTPLKRSALGIREGYSLIIPSFTGISTTRQALGLVSSSFDFPNGYGENSMYSATITSGDSPASSSYKFGSIHSLTFSYPYTYWDPDAFQGSIQILGSYASYTTSAPFNFNYLFPTKLYLDCTATLRTPDDKLVSYDTTYSIAFNSTASIAKLYPINDTQFDFYMVFSGGNFIPRTVPANSTLVSLVFTTRYDLPIDSSRAAVLAENFNFNVTYQYYQNTDVSVPGTPATDSTVSQFESLNDGLMTDFDEYQSVEDSYNDSFKSAERAVSGQFSNWSWGRLTQGTTFLSTQLQNFYNYSGDFKQLIVYPLLAGVALVFLGRWASVRSSKRSRDARRSDRNKRSGGS